MRARLSSRAWLALVLCAVVAVLGAADGGALLALVPALALVLVLALGVFPGSETLERLATRRHRRPRHATGPLERRGLRRAWRPARLLLALSLACRPPPLASLVVAR